MDDQTKANLIAALDADIVVTPFDQRPLMAHYTSISTLELIMRHDELWFSNPLAMNDHEEVTWGINNGHRHIVTSPFLRHALTEASYNLFQAEFAKRVQDYGNKHLFNTYVFCLSAHTEGDNDGLLSMWRGYGGNGTGAAIIFDPKKLNYYGGSRSPSIKSSTEPQPNGRSGLKIT